jgi:cyclophilin family peptidyl-prolyl cis-trans isomerase
MKQIAIFMLFGAISIVLTGCEQEASTAGQAQQEQKEAVGYVEKLAEIHQQAPQEIADAVNKENAKLEEAKKILEDEPASQTKQQTQTTEREQPHNNSQKQSSMNNIPKEIDMTLAQTCKSATLKTNKGDVTVKFYPEKAPIAVANFCTLAQNGFYDSLTFHRVIKDFMIQGGDPTGSGMGGTDYKFEDELPAQGEYELGSLAMANSGPNTNGSQFFIVSGQNGVTLPPLYTLFGQVTEGMDVVNAIQEVQTGANDKPIEDVIIETVEVETK